MKKLLLTLFAAAITLSAAAIDIDNVRVTTTPVTSRQNAPAKAPHSTSTADVLVNENFEAWNMGTNEEPDFDSPMGSLNTGIEIDPEYTHGEQWYGHKVYMAGGAVAMRSLSMDQSILNTPRMDYSGSIKITFLTRAIPTIWEDEDGKQLEDYSAHLIVGISDEEGRKFETNAKGNLADLQMYADMGWMEVTIEFDNYSAYNGASIVFAATRTVLLDDVKITTSADEFIAVPVITGVSDVTETSFTIKWEKVRKSYNYYVWLYTCEGLDPETGEERYEIVLPKAILSSLAASDMTVDEYIEAMGGIDSPYLKYDIVSRHDDLSYTFDDLDPAKEYAFGVMSHNVFMFSDKKLHKMTIVPTPAVLDATDITATSFKANWMNVTKADAYDVDLYGVTLIEEDDEEYPIFYEGFDKTSNYSTATDAFDATPCTMSMTLDDLTDNPGWSVNGSLAMEIPGMGEMPLAYMLDGWFGAGMNMTLSSPSIYVGVDGMVKISMKLQCANPDAPIVLQFAGAMYMANMNGNFEATAELELPTNGMEETTLDIACMDQEGSPLFIDYISMTQAVNTGDELYNRLATVTKSANETSHIFTGLDAYQYDDFAYSVTAVKEDGRRSKASERKMVFFKPHNVTDLEAIDVEDVTAVEVARYSIDGRQLNAPAPGINIIRYSDGSTKKVIVK